MEKIVADIIKSREDVRKEFIMTTIKDSRLRTRNIKSNSNMICLVILRRVMFSTLPIVSIVRLKIENI
jgi:hypothetical protein